MSCPVGFSAFPFQLRKSLWRQTLLRHTLEYKLLTFSKPPPPLPTVLIHYSGIPSTFTKQLDYTSSSSTTKPNHTQYVLDTRFQNSRFLDSHNPMVTFTNSRKCKSCFVGLGFFFFYRIEPFITFHDFWRNNLVCSLGICLGYVWGLKFTIRWGMVESLDFGCLFSLMGF